MDPLGRADLHAIASHSPDAVRAVLGRYGRGVRPWLRAGNPYPDGVLPARVDFATIAPDDVRELVAVRGPLHCSDGWGYLSKALYAHLTGDQHAARHLAYYAELRAALSILASQGIGIFNGANCAIDAAGTVHALTKRTTHQMCWLALKAWAGLPMTFETLASAISIDGAPLAAALQTYYPGAGGSVLAEELVSNWGVDLGRAADDQQLRNTSSYSPNDLLTLPSSPADELAFLTSVWSAMQPASSELERHLLRSMLETEDRSMGGAGLSARANRFDHLDPRIQRAVSPAFLERREEAADHPIVAAAALVDASPRAMLGRAVILLRLATGLAIGNIAASGVNAFDDLEPWWSGLGPEKGLWDAALAPTDMTELWFEIEDTLADAARVPIQSRHQWLRDLPSTSHRMFQTERIALWNLCA